MTSLHHLRALLERGDLKEMARVQVRWEPPLDAPLPEEPDPRSEHYEALAFDALQRGFPGWAFSCMRAATEAAVEAGDGERGRQLSAQGDRVLDLCFPPYQDDMDWAEDVRAWIAALDDTAEPPGPLDRATSLRHRFTLRALRTARDGTLLPFDRLCQRFGLSDLDKLLLRVLLVREPEVGVLRPTLQRLLRHLDPTQLTDRLQPERPLLAWGVVRVVAHADPMQVRLLLHPSVLAFLARRSEWPASLHGAARRLQSPDADLAYRDQGRASILAWWAAPPSSSPGPEPWLMLRGCSAPEATHALAAALATVEVGVIQVGPGAPTPLALRSLALLSRLERAAIWVPPSQSAWATALAEQAQLVPLPVVIHERVRGDLAVPLVPLDASLPSPRERARLVNEALVDAGHPALPPRELTTALAPWAAGVADLALAVRAVLADERRSPTIDQIVRALRSRLTVERPSG
ncbi:MAG: hypothetical protein EA397_13165 [Deltaproteobacteria bacterium]|nr:MAG: hypothetical protein EA397_13165 [Deltaproteobacteria bacterium]